jgi:hypothetical protein
LSVYTEYPKSGHNSINTPVFGNPIYPCALRLRERSHNKSRERHHTAHEMAQLVHQNNISACFEALPKQVHFKEHDTLLMTSRKIRHFIKMVSL